MPVQVAAQYSSDMSDESAIYRDLMRFKPDDLSPNAWAVNAGVSRTVWADMRRHGNPSRRTLERLLKAAGSSLAEFEALRIGPGGARPAGGAMLAERARDWSAAPLPPLPLVSSSLVGEWGGPGSRIDLAEIRLGESLEHVGRPASLAGDATAFAVTVVGQGMSPRFRPGNRIAVAPRAPVAIGDDVLIQLKAGRDGVERVLIGQLQQRSDTKVELRQFNPNLSFSVDAAEVDAILRIPGELI